MQLQYGAGSLETAQLEHPQRRAAVETKVEEAAKRSKSDVWNPDKKRTSGGTRWLNSKTRGETLFLSDNETKRTMKFTWWKRPVPWLIMRNR